MKSKVLFSFFVKSRNLTFIKAFNFTNKNKTEDIVHKAVRTHEEASYNRLSTGYLIKKNDNNKKKNRNSG